MSSADPEDINEVHITSLQIRFLQSLIDGPLPLADIAKLLGRSSSATHRVADTLIRRKMVKRIRPGKDKGRVYYEITSLTFKFDDVVIQIHLEKL